MFFAAKPNVTDGEKSRVEFYFQQLGECIGFDWWQDELQQMDSVQ